MKALRWWLRVVGALDLLLGASNLVAIAASPGTFDSSIPFTVTPDVRHAFIDAWFAVVLDLVVVGAAALWASRDPGRHTSLAWLVLALEVGHGALGDVFLMARGYDAAQYGVFLVVHVAIIATGFATLRRASRSPAPDGGPALRGAVPE